MKIAYKYIYYNAVNKLYQLIESKMDVTSSFELKNMFF